MQSKSLIITGILISAALTVLIFAPANESIEPGSGNTKSYPFVVENNLPAEFEITPLECSVNEDFVGLKFTIENKIDDNYRLELTMKINDKNGNPLSMAAFQVESPAGEKIAQSHSTPFIPEMDECMVVLERSELIQ